MFSASGVFMNSDPLWRDAIGVELFPPNASRSKYHDIDFTSNCRSQFFFSEMSGDDGSQSVDPMGRDGRHSVTLTSLRVSATSIS